MKNETIQKKKKKKAQRDRRICRSLDIPAELNCAQPKFQRAPIKTRVTFIYSSGLPMRL